MEKFLKLLSLKRKKEVESFCKTWTISSEDLANFIIAGSTGALSPYKHWRYHVNIEPEHLWPTEEELGALARNGVGKIRGEGLKALNKISELFEQRKLISVHLFYHPSKKYWHMFYFNQRDTDGNGNHWDLGPHIHYTHDTFLNATLDEVVSRVTQDKPKLPKSIHIKYDCHHNRKVDA